jgi:hypothetical protein
MCFNLDVSYPSSSTPIVAVRRVMNTLLSQRTKELEQLYSQKKPPRGKRLPNNTGLNITDDEFVLMKLKESEEKKSRKQKVALIKDSNVTSTSTNIKTIKRRGRPPKKDNNSTQQHGSNDSEVQNGILSLKSAIKMANCILDSEDSDEE